jgi:hypothetical protein
MPAEYGYVYDLYITRILHALCTSSSPSACTSLWRIHLRDQSMPEQSPVILGGLACWRLDDGQNATLHRTHPTILMKSCRKSSTLFEA